MRIVQITPGAGRMYCGNCFRDNALVAALRRLGHDAWMIPLYLPLSLDEEDQSAGTPIFYSGLNVYLEQKSALFRRAPQWLHRVLASRPLLQWAAGRAAKTRAEDSGDLMLSMLRGEEGHQARELDELIAWLAEHARPDIICLSNALLAGLARPLRRQLQVPVVCMLQGEDTFLDALPATVRDSAWALLGERARELELSIAPSRYFAQRMTERLRLEPGRVQVVPNGINLEGFADEARQRRFADHGQYAPVVGYFARMCREKGLHTLVEAFLQLKRHPDLRNARLHIGGGLGPADEPFVHQLKLRLEEEEFLGDARFFPNVSRSEKIDFLHGLTVFSVPAQYGEAFGLYVLEALAAGVPVVQPRTASFTEMIEATGGGLLCEPEDPAALADALGHLLLHPTQARHLGQRGQEMVRQQFSVERMAENILRLFEETRARAAGPQSVARA